MKKVDFYISNKYNKVRKWLYDTKQIYAEERKRQI